MVTQKKTSTKKKTATKTAAKKKTVRPAAKKRTAKPKAPPEEAPLTPEEVAQFRQLLLEKRREIIGDVDHMRNEALESNRQESSGDLSNMPIHMADIGTDNYEQEFTLGLIESERKALRDIDHALTKIEQGTYGVCEGTGKVINRARLEAKPEARHCIEYARMIEQGQKKPKEEIDSAAATFE
jgi:DnaK suppressor protein